MNEKLWDIENKIQQTHDEEYDITMKRHTETPSEEPISTLAQQK
jgi:hypothetical protein